MRIFPDARLLVYCALAASLASLAGAAPPAQDPIANAQKQITAYLIQLADLHCTESVTQEKLAANGHIEHSTRAQFDYLIMMSGSGDEFQLNESRIESAGSKDKQQQLPMLVTNGVRDNSSCVPSLTIGMDSRLRFSQMRRSMED